MASRQLDEEAIFHVARELGNLETRAKYLEQVCAGDQKLRERVEALLKVHDDDQGFLRPSSEPVPTVDQQPITERPGTTIGCYKLMEQIGEGGMGVVFVAEQQRPIQRKVALKVIKPGMDSKAVIVRFDVERQALAMMDHPNIASVLDAGTTESGRPYFVMELVRGVPVTEYCDQNTLSIAERLELFIQVCQAIQHAHQKGIIHRDIKPSNVLVTLHDDKPVIKVIDFGVAKAMGQRLTEQTVYTGFAQAIGTPLYMSPEQAGASGLDIDTRTDIYSLGVLLYELLTGTTPFDKHELDKAAYEEVRRIIRERDPAKPSTRISTLGATLQSVSAQRKMDPNRLCRFVRGDLDWIVMKSLEKDRTRRYETANGFAADVLRFLSNEPIEARPPTAVYRLRKTVARHRVAFATSAIVMLALLGGMLTSLWFARSAIVAKEYAESEGKAARAAEQKTQLILRKLHDELVEDVILDAQSGDQEGTEAAMKLARESAVPDTTLQMLQGIAHYYNGDNASAIRNLENVVTLQPENVTARAMLALSCGHNGGWNRYSREILQAREGARTTATTRKDYESLIFGCALMYLDVAQCVQMLQETVDRHPEWAVARAMLGGAKAHLAIELSDTTLASKAMRETKLARELLPENRVVALYNVWTHRVAIYFAQLQGQAYEDTRLDAEPSLRLLMEKHANYTAGAYNLATFYEVVDEDDTAMSVLGKAVGDADHDGWTYYYVGLLVRCGRLDEALELFDRIKVRSVSARHAMAAVLAMIPEKRKVAEHLLESLAAESEQLDVGFCVPEIYCLLGERSKATSESQKCLSILHRYDLTAWAPAKSLAFYAGNTEGFRQDCGETPLGQVEFHYHMAMRRLSEGDKQDAIRHFDDCAKLNVTDSWCCTWARAFRQLLAMNPNRPGTQLR